MRNGTFFIILIAGAIVVLTAHVARAANCSLHNPDRQIYELFPEATGYRSIVGVVDEALKPAIESKLGSSLTFNDLARHTIYVVLKDDVPVGFIHPRSEIGKHGLVELVWALDLDLRVRGFRVQRSREQHTSVIASDNFRAKLLGRNHRDLQENLVDGNTGIDVAALEVPSEAESIAHTTILCGAKTLIITDLAFKEQLSLMRLIGNVHRFFPKTAKVTKVAVPLRGQEAAAPKRLDIGSLVVARSLDKDGNSLGAVAVCRCSAEPGGVEYWWAVESDGVLRDAVVVEPDAGTTRAMLAGLRETTRKNLQRSDPAPSSPVGECAAEVLEVLTACGVVR